MKTPKKLLIYKILIVIFMVLIILVPDVTRVPEIDLRVLVTVIGIDKTEKGIKTSAQIIIPMAEGEGQLRQEVISADGRTISESLDMLSISMGRKVELGHCGMIVLGQKLAEDNVLPHLKHLLSGGMMSAGVNLVTTEEIEAAEFIELANKLSEASSSGISNFITYSTEGAHIATLTLLKFLSNSYDVSNASYIPCIEIKNKMPESETPGGDEEQAKNEKKNGESKSDSKGEEKGEDSKEGEKGGSRGAKEYEQEGGGSSRKTENKDTKGGGSKSQGKGDEKSDKTEIKNVESVVMFERGKRIKKLNKEETRGIAWIDSKSDKGLVMIDNFEVDGNSLGPISGQLKQKNVKLKCEFVDGKPSITFTIGAAITLDDKYKIIEYWNIKAKKDDALTAALGESFNSKIRDEITSGLNSVIENNCDIMAIKAQFNRFKHKEYKKYIEEKPNSFFVELQAKFEIKCRIH